MTDTTTVDETAGELRRGLPELGRERRHLGADGTAAGHAAQDAGAAPVPRAAARPIAIVAVLVLNISRVFLAGDNNAALGDRHDHHRWRS